MPEIPACVGPFGVPRSGKTVIALLQVVKEGPEWVGRATAATDEIELRFKDEGQGSLGRRRFAGTIRGRARHAGVPGLVDPRDVTVTIGGAAVVEGETAFIANFSTLVGTARGDFQFSDSGGAIGNCNVVSIHINAPTN